MRADGEDQCLARRVLMDGERSEGGEEADPGNLGGVGL